MIRTYTVILFVFVNLISSNSFGQNKIKWMSWKEAVEKSKVEKKKIFVDIYTDWCGWCKKMDKSTLSQGHLASYLNQNFYSVKFDAESTEPITINNKEYKFIKVGEKGYHEFAVHLLQGQMSYPSIVFLDEEFNIIQSIPGYQNAEIFEMIITYFGSNSHKSIPWQKYTNNYSRSKFFDYNQITKN